MIPFDLEVAVQAAQKAAEVVRRFESERDGMSVRHKEKFDLVTDADVASEETIKAHIASHFPADAFLGEETSLVDPERSGRCWIVDPIDGTTNFAHGLPPYCISIALYENGRPLVGVVLEVARNEMFTAHKGGGAFLNGRPIHVTETTDPVQSLVATGFPVTDGTDYTDLLAMGEQVLIRTQGFRRPGSAAFDLCAVAAGRVDVYYEIGLKPWDVAAGVLIASEAGAVVTDMDGGQDWLLGRRIIVGNPAIHAWTLDLLAEYAPALRASHRITIK